MFYVVSNEPLFKDPALIAALRYCLIWILECTSNAHLDLVSMPVSPA